ncbi:MAG: BlaI/MecI/CopY family transcriptional regulator [Bacillus subtilis]|nr:BlaI/MecI/CopY family transcriptional regulator [Bacillus subtilis]
MPKLTDAEWQIMRVLWESKAASASQIASALMDSKAWKITTVKTFLSRLVEKQWIRFEEQGKKFVYLPLWSERECVFQEMKQVLQRIYGGKVLLQTPRFEFYGVDYPELIKRLSAHLEAQADRIELRYQIKYAERQQVYLYGSTYRLHSALGRLSAPEWLRAGLEWDIIHLAPEAAFDDLSIEAAATQVWMQKNPLLHQSECPVLANARNPDI